MSKIYSLKALLLGAIMLFSLSMYAQENKKHCGTSDAMKELYKIQPQAKVEALQLSDFTKSFVNTKTKAAGEYVIPIVFHVFGTNFNGLSVTDDIIIDALQKTNEDFQGLTADWNDIIPEFDGVKEALNITFKLAQIDPNGNPTTGINYYGNAAGFGNGSGYDAQIQQYAWDNYKYFNVYIQNDLYDDGATNNSGVCWYPNTWMSDNNLARCVYNGAYLGNNTNENFRSVLTHEFGHYLNLIHTFEGGCPDAGSCSTSGDEICDTPPADYSSMNGALNCQGVVTNWQNFMDYTNNYAMFTTDQVARMEAALQHSTRFPLWQASNLDATGVNANIGPSVMISSTLFEERYQNDGAVETQATISATNGAQFATSGNLVQGTHFNVVNVPAGLNVNITVTSSTTATISFNGSATSHANANDVSGINITFLDPAIVGGASTLYSATISNLKIDYIDPYQIVYENIADISVNSTDTWVWFSIQNGEAYGIWYDGGKLRLETYEKPLVCQGAQRNISKISFETEINSSSNWIAGGAYPDEHDLRTSSYTVWDGQTGYIGFQFSYKGHPCYGWFKVTVASDGQSYTLTEYAYNEEPYASILAGTTNSGGGEDTEAPTAPGNLIASNITETSLDLNWNASTDNVGVTGYDLYRNGAFLTSVTGTTASVTSLTQNTSYDFYVIAKDAAGNTSVQSNTISATTLEADVTAPSIPQNLNSSNITENSVDLSWDASTDNRAVTFYNVLQDGNVVQTVSTTNASINGLSSQTTYMFTVQAGDEAGNLSNESADVSVTTLDATCSYCAATTNDQSYEWITGVQIGSFSKTSGKENGGYSDFFATETINLSAGATESVTLTPNNSQYTEHWAVWIDFNNNCSFDDAGELVLSGSAQGNLTGNITIPANVSGETRMRIAMRYNNAPSNCGSYDYGEVEDYKVSFGGAIPDTEAPTTPTNLSAANITTSSVDLSWSTSTDNVGVDVYEVYRDGSLVNTVSATSASISGLSSNTTYSFTVKAKDEAGNSSSTSQAVSVTTLDVQTVVYCDASGTNGPEHIARVQVGSIDNSSARTTYTDFTSISTSMNRGSSQAITVTIGDLYNGDKATCWVDWNIDGDFEDANEKFALSVSGSTATGTITVPSNATVGQTRMRVRVYYYSAGDVSCGTATYGEVEDYTIVVNASAAGVTAVENVDFINVKVYPNPATDILVIQIENGKGNKFELINLSGQTMIKKEFASDIEKVNISELTKGMYILKISSHNSSIMEKVIIE